MKKQFKADFFNYTEIVAAEPLDEVVVCLDDRERQLLLALLAPARWATRWYNGDVDKDVLEAFVDGIAAKLSTGCAMELVLDACGLALKVGGTIVSEVDLLECVNFYSLQFDNCELTLYESGEPLNVISIADFAPCLEPQPLEVTDFCNGAWVMAEVMAAELAQFVAYDLDNGPFSNKFSFVLAFRTAHPDSVIAHMGFAENIAIASTYEEPNIIDVEIFTSAPAIKKAANIIYCALLQKEAGDVLALRWIIGQYINSLEFFGAPTKDLFFQFWMNLTGDNYDAVIGYVNANPGDHDCEDFEDCTPDPVSPPSFFVCGGYEAVLTELTPALADGTQGRYRIELVWYDLNVEQTGMRSCISESSGACFVISEVDVTVGPTPDGAAGTPAGHILTDCDYNDSYHSDINETLNVPAVVINWIHSANTPITIEFDMGLYLP